MRTKIWVSGIGIVCSLGNNIEEFTQALLQGREGFKKITEFNTRKGKDKAALVSGYQPNDPDRTVKMLRKAVKEALSDACLPSETLKKTALVMATMSGDTKHAEIIWGGLDRGRPSDDREKISSLIKYPMTSLLDALARTFKVEGPRTVVSNACASGNIAIGYAMNLLETGCAEAVIVCGAEFLKETTYWGMHGLRMLSHELKAFDKQRNGTVLGEGTGVLVLEHAESVVARDGRAWGELAGYGIHCDPESDSIIPDKDGGGLATAMNKALISTGIKPEDIDYLNAYGAGTVSSDLMETMAIKKLFCDSAAKLPVSSSKTFLGNCGGAGGVLEAIVTLVAINKDFIPPTLHWENRDQGLDLDYVPGKGRYGHMEYSLSNSIGGGGVNTSIVIKSTKQLPPLNKENKRHKDICKDKPEEVVITGIGLFSPLGNELEDFKNNILKIHRENINNNLNRKCSKESMAVLDTQYYRANPAAQYLLMAARNAADTARLREFSPEEVGIIIGTAFGGYTTTAKELCETIVSKGPNFITPYLLTNNGHNLGATLLSQLYGISGYSVTLTSGNTAGLDAIIHAVNILNCNDELKAILVGGVDILDTQIEKAYSYIQDINRSQYALGEGAGAFILEKKNSALQRGMRIYGSISGYEQGGFPIGRGSTDFSIQGLKAGLKRMWMKEYRPELLLYHIPSAQICQSIESNVEQFLNDLFMDKQVTNLEDYFGEAHAATGVLGLAAALVMESKKTGILSLAPGGSYRYLECESNNKNSRKDMMES